MCADLKIQLLGALPVEPKVARAADEGSDFLSTVNEESLVKKEVKKIVQSM